LAIYPNTSSAQRAKAAYDRLNAVQAKENLIRLAGKRFGKPDGPQGKKFAINLGLAWVVTLT
jgi:hypothetical protein